jgi:hypothetical protein
LTQRDFGAKGSEASSGILICECSSINYTVLNMERKSIKELTGYRVKYLLKNIIVLKAMGLGLGLKLGLVGLGRVGVGVGAPNS